MSDLPPTPPPAPNPAWLRLIQYLAPFALGVGAMLAAIHTGDRDLIKNVVGGACVCALTLIQAKK
jgi:hypothetical protein